MIQDIAPHKFHNEYRKDARPEKDSPVLCFDGRKALVKRNEEKGPGEIELPLYEQVQKAVKDTVYAFAVDETEYFLDISRSPVLLPGYEYIDIFTLRLTADNVQGMILFTGFHLASWYKDSAYCGRCGNKNEHSDHERAMHCPECDRNIYPRIMPAVIVGVTDGERILLTQYREGYGYNALVAGFAEIGETLEETVAREVMEETGVPVKNITYYKSQPWGIANDLLVGYYCEADGDCEIHMDENELRLARWTERKDIVLQPDSYSLTNEMMKMFKEHGAFWKNSYRFFENRDCRYYPCHKGIDELNCMFCYCPMYSREDCLGEPKYKEVRGRIIKDCTDCTFPHRRENYDSIIKKLMQ